MVQTIVRSADYSTEARCLRILERNRDTIRVQKDRVAIAKLSRIVESALELSSRQGFHGMTLRDLSVKSGVSMGSLYSYFDSKNTLLSMILGEVTATVMEVLQSPPACVAGDPGAHLKWLVDTHIRLTEMMQKWFVFAFMEAKSFPRSARDLATESEAATEGLFAEVLARGIDAGAFRPGDPSLTAAFIKPLLQDWYVKRGKYRRRGVDIDAYIAGVTEFILNAISPIEAR